MPYVRTGGAQTSGTAASFYNDIYLDGYSQLNNLSVQQQKAFEVGTYGNQINIKQTDEANSRA